MTLFIIIIEIIGIYLYFHSYKGKVPMGEEYFFKKYKKEHPNAKYYAGDRGRYYSTKTGREILPPYREFQDGKIIEVFLDVQTCTVFEAYDLDGNFVEYRGFLGYEGYKNKN